MPTDPKKNDKKQTRSELKREEKRKSVDKATKESGGKGKAGKKEKSKKPRSKKPRRRVLPIWLRLIIVLVLSAIALLIGLMVGYGVIGEGQPTDALDWSTWQHIWDIVTKTE